MILLKKEVISIHYKIKYDLHKFWGDEKIIEIDGHKHTGRKLKEKKLCTGNINSPKLLCSNAMCIDVKLNSTKWKLNGFVKKYI